MHGEEDRNLSRGRPLLLAPGRLRELQQVWRSNGLRELLYLLAHAVFHMEPLAKS